MKGNKSPIVGCLGTSVDGIPCFLRGMLFQRCVRTQKQETEKTDMENNLNKNNKNEKNDSAKKNLIYKIGFIVFTAAFVFIVGLMIKNYFAEQKAQEDFEQLSSQTVEKEEQNETQIELNTEIDVLAALGIEVPEKDLDWESLYETNEDIYAWIYIPNTNVDYPVLQHPGLNDYYLDYNLDHSKGYPGCIYSQVTYNNKEFTDFNTVLYGHNMRNGTMFRTLHNFEEQTFFDENRYVYIYTPEKVLVYDIFAAYAFDDRHILAHFDNANISDREDYLEEIFGIRDMSAHFRKDIEVTTDSNILTLVTCISTRPDQRYLVQGVLLNP